MSAEPVAYYIATFDRIGRNHFVAPLNVTGDADTIAGQVYRYALRSLGSRDVEVHIDLENLTGRIFAGMRDAGSLTLAAIAGEEIDLHLANPHADPEPAVAEEAQQS